MEEIENENQIDSADKKNITIEEKIRSFRINSKLPPPPPSSSSSPSIIKFTGKEEDKPGKQIIEIITNIQKWEHYNKLWSYVGEDIAAKSQKYKFPIELLEKEFMDVLKVILSLAEYMFIKNPNLDLIPLLEKDNDGNLESNNYFYDNIAIVQNWHHEYFNNCTKGILVDLKRDLEKSKYNEEAIYPFIPIWSLIDKIFETINWWQMDIRQSDKYLCSFTGRTLNKGESVYLLQIYTYKTANNNCNPQYYYISKHPTYPSLYLEQIFIFIHYRWNKRRFVTRIYNWQNKSNKFPPSIEGFNRMKIFMDEQYGLNIIRDMITEYTIYKNYFEKLISVSSNHNHN